MLPCDREGVERRKASRRTPCFHIEFRANAPDDFRFADYSGKHSSKKKQVARLHRFRVDAERLRRHGEFNAKFLQPLLSAGKPRAFSIYHLPACAPPSTCRISPEVNVASVRNKAASTISLTSPILLAGLSPFRKSSVSGLCMGVLITPGAMVFTRMPSLAYSMASARVTAFNAPFNMI